MRSAAILLAGLGSVLAAPLWAREVVDAAAPSDIAVTIYRDPDRGEDEKLNRDNPRGLAMISETRRVTLPKGESTIRFEGVAEGMIGISAIVTGLPGGTIEKNRNAALLSPASLVDGTLGNRVTITRMNPATGQQVSESAVVRTRADGGLVLQTGQGFEAVQCSGLPETLTFDRVPAGLSAAPVFSVDTRSAEGGTYDVTLTYLAWGFDWQANYVGTLKERGAKAQGDEFEMGLLSWLTLVNDNGQSFDNARLQIVAGELNVESDYESLADPPVAEELYLTCYPLGSTSAGGIPELVPPPPPAPPMLLDLPMPAAAIVVTGSRLEARSYDIVAPVSVVTASEEDLGDLKLFRVPGRIDVSAKGMKQVAFLNKEAVKGRLLYEASCSPDRWIGQQVDPLPAGMLLVTKNEEKKGLGTALPQGGLTLYEPSPRGERLAGSTSLRDYARGQDIELDLAPSTQVFARCASLSEKGRAEGRQWNAMRAVLSNANPHPVKMRLQLGWAGGWQVRFPGQKAVVKNGWQTVELTLPANSEKTFDWKLRDATAE
ncbi:MAG: hypothetical protein O9293_04400 [Porphyrobacter sp.]|nr:hypothetical protein [Porphyrobacter sp.]